MEVVFTWLQDSVTCLMKGIKDVLLESLPSLCLKVSPEIEMPHCMLPFTVLRKTLEVDYLY